MAHTPAGLTGLELFNVPMLRIHPTRSPSMLRKAREQPFPYEILVFARAWESAFSICTETLDDNMPSTFNVGMDLREFFASRYEAGSGLTGVGTG